MVSDGKAPRGRPPERLAVRVYFKRAMSHAGVVENVIWPKGWPLPQPGDQIMAGTNSGFVTHVSFDVGNNRLAINTR